MQPRQNGDGSRPFTHRAHIPYQTREADKPIATTNNHGPLEIAPRQDNTQTTNQEPQNRSNIVTNVSGSHPVPSRTAANVMRQNTSNSSLLTRHPHKMQTSHQRAIPTISSLTQHDSNNPQYVTQYTEEILQTWRECEIKRRVDPRYMSKQRDLTPHFREVLIDWLSSVRNRFQLKTDTLALTITLIDRFLQYRSVDKPKLQLLGCAAMFIACKYEEIYTPELNDFVIVSDRAFPREQMLSMEKVILTTLRFEITAPYAHHYAQCYIHALQLSPSDESVIYTLSLFLIESTYQNFSFVGALPSHIAAAAVSLALHFAQYASVWNVKLEAISGLSLPIFSSIVHNLWNHVSSMQTSYHQRQQQQQNPSAQARPTKSFDSIYRTFSSTTLKSVTQWVTPFDPVVAAAVFPVPL